MDKPPMKMVIAAYLLVESCQHTHPDKFESGSRWGPLIDVLPKDIVPTLVTFDEDAYEALSDENLEANGKMAALQLVSAYFGDPKRGMREGIKDLLVDIIKSRIDPGADFPLECVDYAEFLRWISVMDSRSIAINGLIMILPLAHMINFEPQPTHPPREGREVHRLHSIAGPACEQDRAEDSGGPRRRRHELRRHIHARGVRDGGHWARGGLHLAVARFGHRRCHGDIRSGEVLAWTRRPPEEDC